MAKFADVNIVVLLAFDFRVQFAVGIRNREAKLVFCIDVVEIILKFERFQFLKPKLLTQRTINKSDFFTSLLKIRTNSFSNLSHKGPQAS